MAGAVADEAYVLGVLFSALCHWQARRTVELYMTFEEIGLLTIPDPGARNSVQGRAAKIAAPLAAVDESFADWADEVDMQVGSAIDESVKQDLICELTLLPQSLAKNRELP